MIVNLPGNISIVFILTTFLTADILLNALERNAFPSTPAKASRFLSFPFYFSNSLLTSRNRAALYFPLLRLLSVIVPTILFYRLASLW